MNPCMLSVEQKATVCATQSGSAVIHLWDKKQLQRFTKQGDAVMSHLKEHTRFGAKGKKKRQQQRENRSRCCLAYSDHTGCCVRQW